MGLVGRYWVALLLLGIADAPRPGDDATFRPTVMIRSGTALGSGTIIASAEDETLVLTASHVIRDGAPVVVELNRFNYGVERTQSPAGFPRRLAASVEAEDPDADLAILKIRGQLAFPFVARIASGDTSPPRRTPVTSIGFDLGARLIGSTTRVRSLERLQIPGRDLRSFLVTDNPPEIGRSGGGLFREDGALVGVCVGRVELSPGQVSGLFAPLANIKALVRSDDHLAASLVRANLRPSSPAR